MGRGIRHTDTSPGWVNRRFRELERQIRELRAERRLRSSSFDGVMVPTESQQDATTGGAISLSASNFAPTATGLHVIDEQVIVPSPFNAVVITVTGRAYAINDQATDDYLYAATEIEGPSGGPITSTSLPAHAGPTGAPNEAATNVAPLGAVLMGLTPGEVFNLRLWVRTSTADWTADVNNTADLSGSLTWFVE